MLGRDDMALLIRREFDPRLNRAYSHEARRRVLALSTMYECVPLTTAWSYFGPPEMISGDIVVFLQMTRQ